MPETEGGYDPSSNEQSSSVAAPESSNVAKPEKSEVANTPRVLIDPETAKGLDPEKQSTEFKINYVEQTREALVREAESRYGVDRENKTTLGKLRNMLGRTKAYMAGEYADINKVVSGIEREGRGEKGFNEVRNNWREQIAEGARKVEKVLGKTALSGAIGGIIAAGLGGTVGGPAFVGALVGAGVTRGAFEIWRSINPKEREARCKVMGIQQKVLTDALRMQQEAAPLAEEYKTATPERKAELEAYFAKQSEYFVNLTHFKSFEVADPNAEVDKEEKKPATTLADVAAVGNEKNAYERKMEKRADWVAAGGSLVGGLVGAGIHNLLAGHAEKAAGYYADFDKDSVKHFVTKIDMGSVAHADPGFAKQLHESGGYVFKYLSPETHGKVFDLLQAAHQHGYHLTTALLKDGSQVHVLKNMSDGAFAFNAGLAAHGETVSRAAAIAGSFLKEAVPVAAANLFGFFGGWKSKGPEAPNEGVKGKTEVGGEIQKEKEGKEKKERTPFDEFEKIWEFLGGYDTEALHNAGIKIVEDHTVEIGGKKSKDVYQNNVAQLRTIAFAYDNGTPEPSISTLDYTEHIDEHAKKLTYASLGGRGSNISRDKIEDIRTYLEHAIKNPNPALATAIDRFKEGNGEENLREDGVWVNEEGQDEEPPPTVSKEPNSDLEEPVEVKSKVEKKPKNLEVPTNLSRYSKVNIMNSSGEVEGGWEISGDHTMEKNGNAYLYVTKSAGLGKPLFGGWVELQSLIDLNPVK